MTTQAEGQLELPESEEPVNPHDVVKAFSRNPAFRAAEWEELTTEENPFRRPVRPDDLAWLNYSKPMPVEKVLMLSGLLGHRMLRNIYDADLLYLAPSGNAAAAADRRDFYADRNRTLGAHARPVHAVGLCPAQVHGAPASGLRRPRSSSPVESCGNSHPTATSLDTTKPAWAN